MLRRQGQNLRPSRPQPQRTSKPNRQPNHRISQSHQSRQNHQSPHFMTNMDQKTRNTKAINNLIDQIRYKTNNNIIKMVVSNTTPTCTQVQDDEKTIQKHKLQKLRNIQKKILQTIVTRLDYKPTRTQYTTAYRIANTGLVTVDGYQIRLCRDDIGYYHSPSIIIDDNMTKIIVLAIEYIKDRGKSKTFDLADPNLNEQVNKTINEIVESAKAAKAPTL